MSLADSVIESFNGYEKAKAVLNNPNASLLHNVESLKQRLLEYRRAHNIFEVGDYALPNSNHSDEVHFLSGWYIEGLDFRYKTNSGDWGVIVKSCMTDSWRHATDAEIEAGKRLDNKEKH